MPAIVRVPMPPAVVVGEVTPGIIRVPDIAVKRRPDPSSVRIGAPISTDIIRYPDMFPVRVIVNPPAAARQFVFIIFISAVQVA